MAGFEPALSCSRSRRIGQAFPHPESFRSPTSAQRESNPHVRHGKAVGYRYIMGTIAVPRIVKESREHRVGLEPTSPPYEGGVFAARSLSEYSKRNAISTYEQSACGSWA